MGEKDCRKNNLSGIIILSRMEVREEFIRAVKNGKRTELVKAIIRSEQLLDATLRMDEDAIADFLEEVHGESASPQRFYW